MKPYSGLKTNPNKLLNQIMIILIHIQMNMATRYHSEEVIERSLKPRVHAISAVAQGIMDTSTQTAHTKVLARILTGGDTHVGMGQRNMDFVNGKDHLAYLNFALKSKWCQNSSLLAKMKTKMNKQ